MIPKKVVSREITLNPYGNSDMCNLNTYHAEEAYAFLKKVYNKKIPYVTDIYAMLANTFERFYKGILEEYAMISDYEPSVAMLGTHRNEEIAEELSKIGFPVVLGNESLDYLTKKLSELSNGYTRCRYKDVYEFSDFCAGFELLEEQRERLYKSLDEKCKESQMGCDRN